ncbi:RloB family protein [Serratia bockelmannii]|uniref:RloB family protein n=1 Tax=Serratia TaxID=613 RepID=UPI000F8E1194|nr:RloB family protein [Serratia marcescens]
MAKKTIKPKRLMHIICEGAKTEPFYFSSYIDNFASEKAKVIEIPNCKKNTPVQLVDEAVSRKKSKETSSDDEFWVVYDREAVAKYSNKLHAQAWSKALANNINIAFSNICFELWILQHFELTTSPFTCCEELLATSNLRAHLKRVGIHNYEKGNAQLFSKISGGLGHARVRAARLNELVIRDAPVEHTNKPYMLNCYTNIYELLDAIDKFQP